MFWKVLFLCSLVLGVVEAAPAMASTEGTTAFTCAPGGAQYSDAHCRNEGEGFGHKELAANPTKVEGTNANTKSETKSFESATLLTTAGGLETEIKCPTVSSTGTIENKLSGESHSVTGSGIIVKYSFCTVPKPSSQECKVVGGSLTTNVLKAASKEMLLTLSPTSGTTIATVVLEGCKTAGLNKSYLVTGSIPATPEGATLAVSVAKSAGSPLEFGGQPLGLTQKETVRKSGGNPLSLTTAPFTAESPEEGTTAITCAPGGTQFLDQHCRVKGEGFGHKELVANPTEVVASNANTRNETKEAEPAVLTSTAGGLAAEVVCTTVASSGTLEKVLTGAVHSLTGSGIVLKYSNCTVPLPTGQECKVAGGAITTESLKAESEEMAVTFSPASGTAIATVKFEGCKTAGLNKSYVVAGSISGQPEGATVIVSVPKNASSPLSFGGQPSGLAQKETVRKPGGNPLSVTTPPFELSP